jgi:putative ABC transport system permease protein
MLTGFANWILQVLVVVAMNLRTIPQRLGSSSAALVGVAGVVAVMVSVLSIATGFRKTLEKTGSADTAIVMRSGATAETNSLLEREETRIIEDAPGVLRSEAGAVAAAELYVVVDLPKRSTGTVANVPLRGVQPASFLVREGLEIVEGRRFAGGRNELVAGVGAADQFAGLEVGSALRFGKTDWKLVGLFSAGGSVAESELWCDAAVLQPAYNRGSTFQAVYAKLTSVEAFDDFKGKLTGDPRLDVSVVRETEYYAEQSEMLYRLITVLGALVAVLMGIGAIFGALNTMYSAVSSRTREIATLRALGFGGGPVAISVVAESMFLALLGGLIGGAGAYLAFNGYRTATMNWNSFSQVVFAFEVTPVLLVQGIAYALLLGLIGGLFPAIRAARLQIARALREL